MYKVVVSLNMKPEEVDIQLYTGQKPSEAYEDQHALRLVYNYENEEDAKNVVEALLTGSPVMTAAIVPDFRPITLMRWMNQYPNSILMFQYEGSVIVPIPSHQKVAGCGYIANFIPARIKQVIKNGFSVMILDPDAVPNPAPNICSCCGVKTDDPAGQAWFTIGHPTTQGSLPYPICEACGLEEKLVLNVSDDGMGTLTLADTIPEVTGFKIRAFVSDGFLEGNFHWAGNEELYWTTHGKLFATPNEAKEEIKNYPKEFEELMPIIVPSYKN